MRMGRSAQASNSLRQAPSQSSTVRLSLGERGARIEGRFLLAQASSNSHMNLESHSFGRALTGSDTLTSYAAFTEIQSPSRSATDAFRSRNSPSVTSSSGALLRRTVPIDIA